MKLRFPADFLLCHLVFSGDTCLENTGKKDKWQLQRQMHVCCVFHLRHILDILTLGGEYKDTPFQVGAQSKTTQYDARKKIAFEHSYFNYKLPEIKPPFEILSVKP